MRAALGLVEAPIDPGWELLRERDVRKRLGDRVWALETAYGRRLLRHNAGIGPACTCDECTWLRTLIDDDLLARLRADQERIARMTDIESFARQRLAEVQRERADIDQQLAELQQRQLRLLAEEGATIAAIAAYERAIAAPQTRRQAPRAGGTPKGLFGSARKGQFSALPAIVEAAEAQGGVIAYAEAVRAAKACGLSRRAATDALTRGGRFDKLETGWYQLRGEAAA